MSVEIGDVVAGHYKVEKALAKGGMLPTRLASSTSSATPLSGVRTNGTTTTKAPPKTVQPGAVAPYWSSYGVATGIPTPRTAAQPGETASCSTVNLARDSAPPSHSPSSARLASLPHLRPVVFRASITASLRAS